MGRTRLIRVMLVDDHEIVRDGLREVLEHSGGFEVVGQAADGEVALEVARLVKPDVIVMDVMMPVKNGIDACREIAEILPETRLLILTAAAEEDAMMEAVAAGATGYLQKHSGKETLLRTLREVAGGEYTIPADVIRRVFAGLRAGRPQKVFDPGRLTPAGERDTDSIRAGQVLRHDRGGQGQSAGHHPKRHLRHPGQTGNRYEAGTGGLGRAKRPIG